MGAKTTIDGLFSPQNALKKNLFSKGIPKVRPEGLGGKMKVRTEKQRPWKVHAVAYCQDCDWSCDNHNEAVKKAYSHAQKTGHYVVVETGYVQHYNNPK